MRSSAPSLWRIGAAALLLCTAPGAFAQLHQDCTVSVLNRNVQVNPDGSWVLPNVPANFGQVRARATCVQNGVTTSGESAFFTLPANGVVNLPEVTLGTATQIPVSLSLTPGRVSFTTPSQTSQLTVTATYPDRSVTDVTAANTGTTYTTSNPAIVTVSANGLLTAVASGTVVIQATHDGAAGLITATVVLSSTDTDGDGIPDDVEIALGLNPNNPIDAQEDFDRDGLTNLQEYQRGTNMRVADSDGDGLPDGQEVALGTNPLVADTDGDGIRDGLEVKTGSNPLDPTSFNLAQALTAIEVVPADFVMTVNTIIGEASRPLTVTGRLQDGTTLDITSTAKGTNYTSSNLASCNFGTQDGRVFGGTDGACTITVTNSGFSAKATGTVRTFAPIALSVLPIPGYANNVDVSGNFAYVAAGVAGLQVVDATDPRHPSIVGALDTPGNANDVRVVGQTAFIADGEAGLQIIDISDPMHPRIVGAVDTPGEAQDVVVSGTRAYIADGAAGLHIIDVSNPAAPTMLGSVDTPGTAKGVDVSGNVAVVADGAPSNAVRIIDITNPTSPQMVGSVDIPGDVKDLVVRDTRAYVAAFTGGLQIVDFSTPSSPRIVGALPNSFVPRDVELSGQFLLAAEQLFPNAVPIVDVSTPGNPIFQVTLDFSPLGDYAGTGIALTSQLVYMTGESFIVTTENGSTGNTRLFIGQYLALEDTVGVPPVVRIVNPTPNEAVIEGSTLAVTVEATDDVAVAAVEVLVNGAVVFTDTAAPFEFLVTVPGGVTSLTLGATAVDFGGNRSVAADVQVTVRPDTTPPTVRIVSPVAGQALVEGSALQIRVEATDDVAVAAVEVLVNGAVVSTDTTAPFELPVTVPGGVTSLTLGATAVDFGDNRSVATDVVVTVIPDRDRDGLPDAFELANGLNPDNPADAAEDPDGDGLTNLQEFKLGTNIFLKDTDGDGLDDAREVALGTNPLLADTDGDGLLDGDEVARGTNPLRPDTDGDGLPDGVEVALGLNPLLVDSDHNGIPDGREDSDGDGLSNSEEILAHTDPANPDTDGDCLPDGQEVLLGTNPLRADTDGDGMPDGYEVRFGLNPNDPSDANLDPDGDGLTNLEESVLGTDPFNPDRVPPSVAQIAPANGATDFPVNGLIIVRFNEPLRSFSCRQEDPLAGTVRVLQGTQEVIGSTKLSSDGLSVTFTPTEPLTGLIAHTVRVQGLRDRAGNRMAALFESAFTTAELADTIPPTVLRTSPPDGQTEVPVNTPLTIEFSERMDPATLTTTSFSVQDGVTGQQMSGMVQVDPSGRTASFVPDRPLAVGRFHTAFLSADITDAARNSLGFGAFTFTTAFAADNERPRLVATSPVHGDTEMPLNTLVMLEFSEPLHTVNVLRGLQVLAHGAPVPGSMALSNGNRSVTFTAAAELQALTPHEVVVTSQVTDLVGNPLDNPGSVTFQTGDTTDLTSPQIVAVSPDNGAVEVGTNAAVMLQFNERINPLTVTTATFQVYHGPTSVPIAGRVTAATDGLSATFTPSQPLAQSTSYFVQAFGLTDLAGQTTGGIFTSFTTGAGADTEHPRVVVVSPPDGTTGVPANARVVVRLSEPVSAVSVGNQVIGVTAGGGPVAGTVSLDSTRTTVTFTPSALLAGGTPYTMAVSSLTDPAGNAVVPFSSRFTTGLGGNNLARAAGVTTNVSSFFPGWPPERVIDGDLNTSWFTNSGDAVNQGTSPFFEILLPGDATVTELRMFGNRESADGADFLAGLLQLFDATGTVLFDSGVLTLPAPERDIALAIANIAGVRRVRFTATADESVTPGFAELEVVGQFADPTLSQVTDARAPQVVSVQVRNGRLVLTFDEVLDPTTITSTTLPIFSSDFSTVLAGTYEVAGTVVTFSPATPLPATVALSGGVQDLAGNSGFVSVSAVDTGAGADTTPPTVVLVTPSEGATAIGPHAPVVLTFSESLNPSTLHQGTLALLANGVALGTAIQRAADNRTVTLSAPLPAASVVTVVATNDIQDLAGNRLADFESHFTTAASVDVAPPFVVTQRPGSGATGVALDASVVLYMSEPLDAATVPGAMYISQNGVLVNGNTTVTENERTIHFVPNVPWQRDALIEVFLTPGARDRAGNALTNYHASFRTAADTRATAPMVVRTNPTNFISAVPRNVVLEVEFNEPLDPATVNANTVILRQNIGGSPVVPSNLSLVRGGRVLRLVPTVLLTANTSHFYDLSTGIRDQDGQALPFLNRFFFTTGDSADTLPPSVVTVTPPDGAGAIGVNANIRVRLSEPINPLTVNDTTIQVSNDSATVLASTISFSDEDREVVLVPHAPLAEATLFRLTVQGIEDHAGNAVIPQTTQFTTGAEPDTTAPEVVRVNPFDGATHVPVNTAYRVAFTEPIDASSVNSSSFQVFDTVQQVAGTYAVSADGRTVSFVPAAPLAVGRQHSVVLAELRDLAGNSSGFRSFSFTTAFAADTSGPLVVGVSPADGLVDVPTNARVVIAFAEPIQTGSAEQVTLRAGGTSVAVIRNLSDGNQTLTLLPVVPLAPRTANTVTIAGVQDIGGNPLAAAVSATFTTETGTDLVPPQVVTVDPGSGAVEVPTNAVIQLAFSERMNPLTVMETTFQVFREASSLPIAGRVTVGADGLRATFTPSQPLAHSTTYFVQASSLADLTGQATGVFSSFTTGEAADTTRPQVVAISPPNGTTGVPANARVVVRLSEPVSAVSVGNAAIAVSTGGGPVVGAVTLDSTHTTVTFTPSALLAGDTLHTVAVSGLTDLAGQAVLPFSSRFTTGAGGVSDTTAPQVVSVQVLNGRLVLTFDEVLDPTTITSTTLPIFSGDFSTGLAGTYVVAGTVVTFSPATPLPATVAISGAVQDLAGNGGFVSVSGVDTGAGADTTPPTVVLVTPSDGATAIGPHAPVVLTFSESLNPSTLHQGTLALLANGVALGTSIQRSADNRTVTLSAPLPAASVITVVATNDIQDLAGNRLADFESHFTTAASVDVAQPFVVNQRPGSGATGVALDASVVVYINEPLDAVTLPSAVFVSQNGVLVRGTTTVTGEGQVIEFVPEVPWAHEALIQVFITSLAQDRMGNFLSEYQGSFRTVADTRTTAPVVVRTHPTSFVADVPRNVVLEVEFNEPLDPATVNTNTIILRQNTSGLPVIDSIISLEREGRVVRLKPNASLAANTPHFYDLTTSLRDQDGQALPFLQRFFFTTGGSEDTLPPSVVTVTPPDGAGAIGVNAGIRVRLSESINPLTVTGSTILLSDGSSTVLPGTIEFSNNDQDVLIVPHAPLAGATLFRLTVQGVEDRAGNAVIPQTTRFTTGSGPDITAPEVLRVDPFDGATNVPVNVASHVEFTEPIDASSVNSNSFQVFDSTAGQGVAGTYAVSANGRTVSFVPEAPLAGGRFYSMFLSDVRDLVGNSLGFRQFTFTTAFEADTDGPLLIGVSPGDGLEAIPINAQVMIEFDEPIQAFSVEQVTLSTGGRAHEVIRRLSNGNQTLTLIPVVPLDPRTLYTITIAGVRDLGGNPLAGAVATTFTTEAGADLVPPTVTLITPDQGMTEVPLNAVVQVTFSEQINPLTVTGTTLQVLDNTTFTLVEGSVVVAADRRSATLTPRAALAPLTLYTIQAFGITDLAGQAIPGLSTSFTTGVQ